MGSAVFSNPIVLVLPLFGLFARPTAPLDPTPTTDRCEEEVIKPMLHQTLPGQRHARRALRRRQQEQTDWPPPHHCQLQVQLQLHSVSRSLSSATRISSPRLSTCYIEDAQEATSSGPPRRQWLRLEGWGGGSETTVCNGLGPSLVSTRPYRVRDQMGVDNRGSSLLTTANFNFNFNFRRMTGQLAVNVVAPHLEQLQQAVHRVPHHVHLHLTHACISKCASAVGIIPRARTLLLPYHNHC